MAQRKRKLNGNGEARTKKSKTEVNVVPQVLDITPGLSEFSFSSETRSGNRKILVFGNGDNGQHGLGEETMIEIKRPRLHKVFEEFEDRIVQVAAGGLHSLGIDSKGRVYSWGINDNGALGRITNGQEELEATPALVEGLEGFRAVQVAAGDGVSLALGDDGSVRCWGQFRGSEGPIGFPEHPGVKKQETPVELSQLSRFRVTQVATGDDHFLALTVGGEVLAAGNGEQFQLGRKLLARRGKGAGLVAERTGLHDIKSVGAGSYHSFAVSHSGKVYGWGLNTFGQLGIPSGGDDVVQQPTEIDALSPGVLGDGVRVVQVVGGTHHTLFLLSDGRVFGCGRADGHEMGLPESHPTLRAIEDEKQRILALRRAKQAEIVAKLVRDEGKSAEDAAALAEVDAARAIPLPNVAVTEPTHIPFPDDPATGTAPLIVHLAAGTRLNHAVSNKGTLYSWGFSNVSQLGLGNEEEAETPTVVANTALSTLRVISATAGGQHSLLVALDK